MLYTALPGEDPQDDPITTPTSPNPEKRVTFTNEDPAAPSSLIDYHLGAANHQWSGERVLAIQAALALCAAVGALYWVPASEYKAENAATQALNIVGSCFTTVLICYTGADMFFRMHFAKQWPDQTLQAKGIISPPLSKHEFWRQNAVLGIFAFISGIPFSTTAITYPPQGITAGLNFECIAYFLVILMAEGMLHFLPVKLTMVDPFYGTIPRWIEQLQDYCFKSQQQRNVQAVQQRAAQALNGRKQALAAQISSQSSALLNSFFSESGKLDATKLNPFLEKSAAVQFDELRAIEALRANPGFAPWIESCARFLGAALLLTSCLGYAANPVIIFLELCQSNIAWEGLAALGVCFAVALYFFTILMTYFGDFYGRRILSDMSCLKNNISALLAGQTPHQLPFLYRLYPQVMSGCVAINALLLCFSYAAPAQMLEALRLPIQIACGKAWEDALMTLLTVLICPGTFFMAWYAPLDFELLAAKYITQYLGGCLGAPVEQEMVVLMARLQTLSEDMLLLSSDRVVLAMENRMAIPVAAESFTDEEGSVRSSFLTPSTSYFNCCKRTSTQKVEEGVRNPLLNSAA